MMLRPSRVVGQMQGIPFFVGKSASSCSVCGRPLTAHESVARGIGPVCVRKHMGPGAHPSGSPQSVHAGSRVKLGIRKTLAESYASGIRDTKVLDRSEKGIESTYVVTYKDGSKALWKENEQGSAESEVMAYEFSKSIGWNIVPETIIPEGSVITTAQRWVEGKTADEIMDVEKDWRWEEDKFLKTFGPVSRNLRKSSKMVVMDQLLQNRDRHAANYMIDATGKQWAIDNNMAFSPSRPMGKLTYSHYGRMYQFGRRVAKDRSGILDAAKDVRRWFKTPAYGEYVAKLEKTHGKVVARQFGLNVADLVDWSRKAKVME